MKNIDTSITKAIRFKKGLVDAVEARCERMGDLSFSSFVRLAVCEKIANEPEISSKRQEAA
jgi:hypothetical protein